MASPFSEIAPVTRSTEKARSNYDRMSKWYDLLTFSETKIIISGLKQLSLIQGENVLELGFGTGKALCKMANSVGKKGAVYGIDLSSGMLNQANKKISKNNLENRVKLLQGNATTLPFESQVFDAVFMSFFLELLSIQEINQVLSECKRVLKPEGRIEVVSLLKRNSLPVRIYEYLHKKWSVLLDCRPIYPKALLTHNGFKIINTQQMSLWGLPVALVLGKKS